MAEDILDSRVARLESDVGHIRTDVADIKSDVRQLRDKMDNGFTEVRDRFESNFRWQIGFLITTLVTVLGAMAAAIHGR